MSCAIYVAAEQCFQLFITKKPTPTKNTNRFINCCERSPLCMASETHGIKLVVFKTYRKVQSHWITTRNEWRELFCSLICKLSKSPSPHGLNIGTSSLGIHNTVHLKRFATIRYYSFFRYAISRKETLRRAHHITCNTAAISLQSCVLW